MRIITIEFCFLTTDMINDATRFQLGGKVITPLGRFTL